MTTTSQSIVKLPRPPIQTGTTWTLEKIPLSYIMLLNMYRVDYTVTKVEEGYKLKISSDPKNEEPVIVRRPRKNGKQPRVYKIYKTPEKIQEQSKASYPDEYEELQKLKNKFLALGRRLKIRCEKNNEVVQIEDCILCNEKCPRYDLESLLGPDDNLAELMEDLVRLHRLVDVVFLGIFAPQKPTQEEVEDVSGTSRSKNKKGQRTRKGDAT